MKQNLDLIWENTLNIIKSELTEVSFNTWLGSIEPITIDENNITLSTPNDFNKQILEDRYLNLIANAIEQVATKKYAINLITPNELKDEKAFDSKENNKADELKKEDLINTTLNPKYVFDEFVIGSSNRFAHAASLAVAESPAKAYNPLFIYGGVGLGKTHLMHAIGHYILDQNPDTKILYVTSEKFTNELINSIKDDKNVEFRNKYRKADVLLVDDIQFIAGKERTQEEFFHTFNALHEASKQIILSSDRPPKEIPTLEERLRSRFEWGLTTDIQAPDYETRIAILRKKAENENMEISNDVFEFIASRIKSNIRELEGALIKVVAYSSLTNKNITVELAKEALKDLIAKDKPKEINIALIKKIVCKNYGISINEINSRRRSRNISFPRQIAMYLTRKLTDLSLPKIGEEFGGRDHTTVIHAKNKISDKISEEQTFKNKIDDLIQEIQQK